EVDGLVLPDLGDAVAQTEPGLTLTRGDHAARVLNPVDGVVVARNHRVLSDPAKIKQSPYDQGWLLVVQPGRLKTNLKNLLFGQETDRWIEDETNRLVALFAQETGYQLAATGGQFVDDVFGQAPGIGWDTLVREFLLT
ncbi:MAG: glycine cleavage system protein H, partial [Proteobacteria bacterium]|nr:glycine cleavage system protein H [Pseudomonadota bacterium]MBU1742815.1 glycine cleavage system protein H [Pseudomonadota bacterium]